MRETYVLGVAMTRFGKYLDKSLQKLAYDPIWEAIRESKCDPHDIDIAFVGNAYAGVLQGQESVRGQVIMREAGISGIPIINVENACASGSTAFTLAHQSVASGQSELALAVGVEKLFCGDTPTSAANSFAGRPLFAWAALAVVGSLVLYVGVMWDYFRSFQPFSDDAGVVLNSAAPYFAASRWTEWFTKGWAGYAVIHELSARIQNALIVVPSATKNVAIKCTRSLTRPCPNSMMPRKPASRKNAVSTS